MIVKKECIKKNIFKTGRLNLESIQNFKIGSNDNKRSKSTLNKHAHTLLDDYLVNFQKVPRHLQSTAGKLLNLIEESFHQPFLDAGIVNETKVQRVKFGNTVIKESTFPIDAIFNEHIDSVRSVDTKKQQNPRPVKIKFLTENGVLQQIILKPVEFDNITSSILLEKFQKMSNMRGINNPYSLIERREFVIDVKKLRKEKEMQKNFMKMEHQKAII